jgi:CheY-like chemotaxis protein
MKEAAPTSLPRILVIDDNAAIHSDFRKILGNQPVDESRLDEIEKALFGAASAPIARAAFRIDSAFQGQEALGMLQRALQEEDPYMLAFVDVRMPPGWDGIETISRLWALDPLLQVVICSAYSDHSWKDIIGRVGQSDGLLVLKKPFDTI